MKWPRRGNSMGRRSERRLRDSQTRDKGHKHVPISGWSQEWKSESWFSGKDVLGDSGTLK